MLLVKYIVKLYNTKNSASCLHVRVYREVFINVDRVNLYILF